MTLPLLAADATLPAVATWMEEVGEALAPGDGFRHFNAMYLMVTRRVVERVAAGACADAEFVARLDVRFARRYQDALLAADGDVARAWRPMRRQRWSTSITPFQFALAGMNAHINRDLVHALGDAVDDLGGALHRGSARHADYCAIDDLLAELMDECKDLLMSKRARSLDDSLGEADDLVEIWSIRRARAQAWTNAQIAQTLGGSLFGDEHFAAIDRTTGMVGRLLLLGMPR